MTARGEPPDKDEGRPPREPADVEKVGHHATIITTSHRQAAGTSRSSGTGRQLRQRRAASQRMVSPDCGCPTGRHADPISCLCTSPPLSHRALNGWRDAARHLLDAGHTPLTPIEVRRALYRRGGTDRALAERLHDACGGEAA